ncbi:MAG: tyrosine-type recombinase/integrase [Blautia faecis]
MNIQPVEPVPVVDDYGNIKRKISNLVFVNSQRRVWIEPNFLALINRIIRIITRQQTGNIKKELKTFVPHMARHTYTTLAYSVGADVKAVSEILGHASHLLHWTPIHILLTRKSGNRKKW